MIKILVMPQYNEERTVIGVLESASRYVDYVVVVNDGSTDSSPGLIKNWMDRRQGVFLINMSCNRGMSGALLAGFCHVYRMLEDSRVMPDDVVINIDADGQHRPEEIPRMIEAMTSKKVDVLLARRDLSGYPLYKRIGNRCLSVFASAVSGFHYNDVECGFRFMRAGVIPGLLKFFTGKRYGCAQEIAIITALLGLKIDNEEPASITHYRPGARMRDGLTNVAMGLLAFLRVKLGIENEVERLVSDVLGDAEVLGFPLDPCERAGEAAPTTCPSPTA